MNWNIYKLLITVIIFFFSFPIFGQSGTITFSQYCNAGEVYSWPINNTEDANVRITYTIDITLNSDYFYIVRQKGNSPTVMISGYQSGSIVIDNMSPIVSFAANTSGYKTIIFQYATDYSQGNLKDLNVLGNAMISGSSTVSGNSIVNGALSVGSTSKVKISNWTSGSGAWIDIPVASGTPSGIGSGGIGVNSWIAYAGNTNQWFTGSATGDLCYRNMNGKLQFGNTSGAPAMTISASRVGIGTTTPTQPLDVEKNADYQLRLGNTAGQGYNIGRNIATGFLTFYGDQSGYNGYTFGGVNGTKMTINGSGNVGIGTTTPKYLLDVKGTIRAAEVLVESVDKFADFVFNSDYQLPTLMEVDKFIQANGHLSNIPSASEVKTYGLNLVEMQVKLLQKIEELTLYVIEQDKKIDRLEKAQK